LLKCTISLGKILLEKEPKKAVMVDELGTRDLAPPNFMKVTRAARACQLESLRLTQIPAKYCKEKSKWTKIYEKRRETKGDIGLYWVAFCTSTSARRAYYDE
jgi:hypothetical protein